MVREYSGVLQLGMRGLIAARPDTKCGAIKKFSIIIHVLRYFHFLGSTPGIPTVTILTICLFFPSVRSAKIGRYMEAEFASTR